MPLRISRILSGTSWNFGLIEKPLVTSPHWASARGTPRVAPLPAQIVGCAQEDIPLPNTHPPLRNPGSPCAAASFPGDLHVPCRCAPRDLSPAVTLPRSSGSDAARTCLPTASLAPFL